MIDRCRRPSDLLFYSVAVVGAFLVGSALYSLAGNKFLTYVDEKLPEIQAQMEEEFDFNSEIETNFSADELSNVDWGGTGANSEVSSSDE